MSVADFIGRDTFTYEIADSEGLTGTAVVTVTVTSSTFLTFTPTDDTTIYEDSPSLNLGSRDALEVDQEEVKDILLRFEVSGVGTQPIASATLRLFSIDASPSGGIFYSTIDTRWSESTVTWATAPQPVGNSFATLDVVEPNEWYEVDVTSLINGDGPVSIRITSEHTDGADYASKENALQIVPILNINLQR
jgi:hypothetical protein